jgi:hypothetical protein
MIILGVFSKPQDVWAYIMITAILSIFLLVGIGLLLGAINMGRRRAALAVTSGHLMVIQTGLFGAKQHDWPAGEIEKICTGPSGMEVNKVPVLELQIYGTESRKFGLLAGRSDEELEWMASELRTALGLSPDSPTSDL